MRTIGVMCLAQGLLVLLAASAHAQHNGTAVTMEAQQIVQWLTGTFRASDGETLRIAEVPVRDVDPVMLYIERQRPGSAITDYGLFGLIANVGRSDSEDNVRIRAYWVGTDFKQAFADGIAHPEKLRDLGPKQLNYAAGCDIKLRPRDRTSYLGHSDPTTCVRETDGGTFYMEHTMEIRADGFTGGDRVWRDKARRGKPSEETTQYQRVTN